MALINAPRFFIKLLDSLAARGAQAILWPRDAMQARPMPSCGVRPSVRSSVTFVNSVSTNKDIFKFFTIG